MRRPAIFFLLFTFLVCWEVEAKNFPHHFRQKKQGNVVHYQKNGHLILKNTVDIGFGALAFSVLTLLNEFEKGKIAGLTVNFDSGCYLDPDLGPNWWEYFFE